MKTNKDGARVLDMDWRAHRAVKLEMETGKESRPRPVMDYGSGTWVTACRDDDGVLRLYKEDF